VTTDGQVRPSRSHTRGDRKSRAAPGPVPGWAGNRRPSAAALIRQPRQHHQ